MKENIDHYREKMLNIEKSKGISDPEVLQMSQELDEKIFIFKQIVENLPNQSITGHNIGY